MRIISGAAGSLRLRVPSTLTRPTTDRVREAVFSSLGDRVEGARVLDLYAGSGSLGIEALSRGAREAVFVDSNREAVETIRKNLEHARLEGASVRQQQVESFLSGIVPGGGSDFDLVLADPPYARSDEQAAALVDLLEHPGLRGACAEGGLLVLESWSGRTLPETGSWETRGEKTYGETRVSYLAPLPAAT